MLAPVRRACGDLSRALTDDRDPEAESVRRLTSRLSDAVDDGVEGSLSVEGPSTGGRRRLGRGSGKVGTP